MTSSVTNKLKHPQVQLWQSAKVSITYRKWWSAVWCCWWSHEWAKLVLQRWRQTAEHLLLNVDRNGLEDLLLQQQWHAQKHGQRRDIALWRGHRLRRTQQWCAVGRCYNSHRCCRLGITGQCAWQASASGRLRRACEQVGNGRWQLCRCLCRAGCTCCRVCFIAHLTAKTSFLSTCHSLPLHVISPLSPNSQLSTVNVELKPGSDDKWHITQKQKWLHLCGWLGGKVQDLHMAE